MKGNTRKLVIMSLLVAVALILSLVENMLPMPNFVPGAKLGLANIVTMIAVLMLTPYEALVVLMARILLGSIFIGGVSGFLYSLGGGILSFVAMILVLRLLGTKISPVGVSATGAYFHSLGQVLVAAVMIQNLRIVAYLPVILATSLIAGVFVGFVANNLLEMPIMRSLFRSLKRG